MSDELRTPLTAQQAYDLIIEPELEIARLKSALAAAMTVVEAAKQAETLGAWTYELSDALRSLDNQGKKRAEPNTIAPTTYRG